jgi:hypothetical protein
VTAVADRGLQAERTVIAWTRTAAAAAANGALLVPRLLRDRADPAAYGVLALGLALALLAFVVGRRRRRALLGPPPARPAPLRSLVALAAGIALLGAAVVAGALG